jgi:hypothetical protein
LNVAIARPFLLNRVEALFATEDARHWTDAALVVPDHFRPSASAVSFPLGALCRWLLKEKKT